MRIFLHWLRCAAPMSFLYCGFLTAQSNPIDQVMQACLNVHSCYCVIFFKVPIIDVTFLFEYIRRHGAVNSSWHTTHDPSQGLHHSLTFTFTLPSLELFCVNWFSTYVPPVNNRVIVATWRRCQYQKRLLRYFMWLKVT